MSKTVDEFLETPGDELGQVVHTDSSGDVDVSLVECFLALTPAQRLEHVEAFANTVLAAWKSRGIEWSGSERS